MFPDRALFILVSLFFLIFVYCSHHTFGETHDSNSGSGELAARRLAPGDELTDRKAAVLAKVFQLDTAFVKERYGDRYTKAIVELSRGNPVPQAAIFAELFGTLNRQQVETLLDTVSAEKTEELKKTPPDSRFVSFLDKLLLAANRIQDPESLADTEAGTAFLKAFDEELKKVRQSNANFHEKLQQALRDGNRQAKDFLKNNFDPKGLLSFLDAQRSTGNQELARNLAKALAEADDSGNHSIDFNGAQGAKERLELGSSDADVDANLARFAAEEGFSGRSFSPKRHAAVDKTFAYPKSGAPEEAASEPAKTPAKSPANSDDQPGPVEKDNSTPAAPPKAKAKSATESARELLTQRCTICHGPGKRQEKVFGMKADGSLANTYLGDPIDGKEALSKVLAATLVDETMPPTGAPLSAAQKETLRAWAKEQNVALPK
jgi:hypothetical protein